MNRQLITLCIAICCVVSLTGADWWQFRGNHSNGVSDDSNPPTSLEKIDWSVELEGRGVSGPIVVGNHVYLTSNSGGQNDRLHVLCFNQENGEKVWERQFWATGQTHCNSTISLATPTPASDGERIYAFFSSNDLACLDLEGNLLWYRGLTHDYPNASNSLGMSSSPIVAGETVVVQVETDDDSFAMGLNVQTGQTRWKLDRPRKATWTSPLVLKGETEQSDLVILQGSEGLEAVAPLSGEVMWTFDSGASTIPSTTIRDGILYVPSGGLTALKPTADRSTPELLWQENRLAPRTASPLVYQDRVYITNQAGVLVCGDAKTGEVLWRLRLKGPFSSTPIVAGEHMYFFNHKGLGQVVQLGEKRGKIVNQRDLEETILCTPALAEGALYVRSDNHLWKFVK